VPPISDVPDTARETAARVRAGSLTAAASADAALGLIAAGERTLRAFAHTDPDAVRAEAARIDAAGTAALPLAGVTVGVKDIVDAAGWSTECNSPIYRGRRATVDAAIVALLRRAGAVVAGKTVTTEFALRTPGPTVNPHNPAHTPGGSSSGSAAAVAAGMVHVAIGTQTGGSVIRPGAYCGIPALKPSFTAVPRSGVKPLSESLDTLGWYGRTLDDLALVAETVLDRPAGYTPPRDDRPLRVALCRLTPWERTGPGTRTALDRAAAALEAKGFAVTAVSLDDALGPLHDAHRLIMAVEAWRNFRWERLAHMADLSEAFRDFIQEGAAVEPEQERAAREAAAEGRGMFDRFLDGYDVVMTASAPDEAPAGLATTGEATFNRVWTLLGVPCVHLPTGLGPGRLPVGVTLVGRQFGDFELLAHAARAEAALAAAGHGRVAPGAKPAGRRASGGDGVPAKG